MTQPEHEAAAPTPLVEVERLNNALNISIITVQAQRIAELEGERDEALRRLGPAMDVHLFRKNIAAVNLPVLVTRYGKPRFVAVAPESYVSPLQLECARGDLADERWHHHHTAEGLRDGNAGLFAKLQAAEAERDEARAGLEKAREALEPFAIHAAAYDDIVGGYPDENVPCCRTGGSRGSSVVTIGDFRKARDALASLNTGARSEKGGGA